MRNQEAGAEIEREEQAHHTTPPTATCPAPCCPKYSNENCNPSSGGRKVSYVFCASVFCIAAGSRNGFARVGLKLRFRQWSLRFVLVSFQGPMCTMWSLKGPSLTQPPPVPPGGQIRVSLQGPGTPGGGRMAGLA